MRYFDFQKTAYMWYSETGGMSSVHAKMKNPYIKEIVSAGYSVLPYILEEIKQDRGHWYIPVGDILGEHPDIPWEVRGKIKDLNILYAGWLEEILKVEQRLL